MALTYNALTGTGSNTNGATFTTASRTPQADVLQIVTANVIRDAGAIPTLTLTGCGITWNILDQLTYSGSVYRLVWFYGWDASPTTGSLTINGGGLTLNGASWNWTEVIGADLADPFPQTPVQTAQVTPIEADLATPVAGDNNRFMVLGGRDNIGAWTLGADYTSLAGGTGAYPRSNIAWAPGNNATLADATYSSGGATLALIVAEIKAAAAAPGGGATGGPPNYLRRRKAA